MKLLSGEWHVQNLTNQRSALVQIMHDSMPSGKKPLHQPMLTQILQDHNELRKMLGKWSDYGILRFAGKCQPCKSSSLWLLLSITETIVRNTSITSLIHNHLVSRLMSRLTTNRCKMVAHMYINAFWGITETKMSAKFLITGCSGSCHFDNLQCS